MDDHLGSSAVVLNSIGTVISREEYYPFGETSFGSYGKKRYRFCGKERDEESGLYYYGARYYAPWMCRFVSVDALAHETPFFSPYDYADDNPVMNNDPTGNQSEAVEPGGGNNITDSGGGTSTGQSAGVNEHTGDYIFHSIDGNRLYNVGPDRNWDYADRDSETGLFINFKTIDPLKPDMDALGTINAIKGESDYIRSAEERYKTAAGALYMGTPGSVSESASAEYWSKTWDNPYRTSLFGVPAKSGNVAPNYVEFDLALLAYSLGGLSVGSRGELTVYRVFGGDARAQGFSWTTVNPRTVKDFRNLAGLPSGGASGSINTADFMIKGKVNVDNIIKSRSALPLDGNVGGLPELIIDPKNVRLTDFRVLKP